MVINEFFRKILGLNEPHCESCDVLQKQLEIANYEKKELLGHILGLTKPVLQETVNTREIEPIRNKAIPFSVKRQMLEAEDKIKAEVLRNQKQSIENLEKELGIPVKESVEEVKNG